MSKSMKMSVLSSLLCEYGSSKGVDGMEVYKWLEERSMVVVGRGRPSKSKSKVVEQDSESEDLFASLVKSHGVAFEKSEQNFVPHGGSAPVAEGVYGGSAPVAEKAAKLAEKEAKAVDKAAKLAEKEAKKQEIEDAKAEKEAKKQEIEDAKAAKLAEKETKAAEKEAKKEAKEQEKAAKLVEKEAKAAEKEAKKQEPKAVKEPKAAKEPKKKEEPKAIEEATEGVVEEEDSVTEIVYEGKKYLKSVISGVVYDMDENEIGTWKNDKIVLNDPTGSEEEEEEYEN